MTEAILTPLRTIDHCVLPVADLAVARERYARLGFTVAPDGVHPFGTVNACVHFADGSFLEPLAIGDRAATDAAVLAGNVFLARDRIWRERNGEEGFSALVLRTDDAEADHRCFVEAGISAGPMLEFARASADLTGTAAESRFRLAFLAPEGEGASFVFTCERVSVAAIDRTALTTHANGVTRIDMVTIASSEPEPLAGLMARLAYPECVEVVGADAAAMPASIMTCTAIRLATRDRILTERLLTARGIGYTVSATGAVHVPPAPGQGAHLIFEEA